MKSKLEEKPISSLDKDSPFYLSFPSAFIMESKATIAKRCSISTIAFIPCTYCFWPF